MISTKRSFLAVLMVAIHAAGVTGLSLSSLSPAKAATSSDADAKVMMSSGRRAFVSKSAMSLPLLFTGLGLSSAQIANAADDEGYEDGPRGLKYKIINPPTDASSPLPERAQNIKAKYTLYLNGFPDTNPNAKKIDSSKGPLGEKPFGFVAGVGAVIKGWDLTVSDMRVGEKRRIIVPSALGYGLKGAGGSIPGGATLYFDMEMVEISAKPQLTDVQVKWLEDNPL